jgi:hypothetical protein
MNEVEFEKRVLELWTRTRVPLTRANLQAHAKVPRAKVERWLDAMVSDGVLELDSDDDGELLWIVRGAARAPGGVTTIAEVERKERLSAEVGALGSAASLALRGARGDLATTAKGTEKKSLVASGALSFFFGPFGWLYAAPLKEALPAVIVYVILCSILPSFLLVYLIGLIGAASGIAGVLYAWSYNNAGERVPLLGKATKALPPRKRDRF